MVMVVMMRVRPWENAVIPVMMVMVVMMVMMIVVLRDLFPALRFFCSDAGVIHLQGTQCIWNGL